MATKASLLRYAKRNVVVVHLTDHDLSLLEKHTAITGRSRSETLRHMIRQFDSSIDLKTDLEEVLHGRHNT